MSIKVKYLLLFFLEMCGPGPPAIESSHKTQWTRCSHSKSTICEDNSESEHLFQRDKHHYTITYWSSARITCSHYIIWVLIVSCGIQRIYKPAASLSQTCSLSQFTVMETILLTMAVVKVLKYLSSNEVQVATSECKNTQYKQTSCSQNVLLYV